MRKVLPILAATALIATVILVTRYDQNYDAGGKGYDIKCEQSSQPTAASASLTCTIHSSQNAEQGKPRSPWWDKLLTWPEGITAWLLMLTLIAICWQSWELHEQN